MIEPVTLFLIAAALLVAGYLLAPRPDLGAANSQQDLEVPTFEAGKPAAVVFGDVWLLSPNGLWTGDKEQVRRMVKAKT